MVVRRRAGTWSRPAVIELSEASSDGPEAHDLLAEAGEVERLAVDQEPKSRPPERCARRRSGGSCQRRCPRVPAKSPGRRGSRLLAPICAYSAHAACRWVRYRLRRRFLRHPRKITFISRSSAASASAV